MATAKKLPSGSWRCQVFSHYEPVFDAQGRSVIDQKTGKPKKRRVYMSFTSDDPTRRGKAEAEALATETARKTRSILKGFRFMKPLKNISLLQMYH